MSQIQKIHTYIKWFLNSAWFSRSFVFNISEWLFWWKKKRKTRLILVPCPFTCTKMVQIFWVSQKFDCLFKKIFSRHKKQFYWCLVLLQVPKCFVPVQIFWASPKNWLHLVPLQNLLCRHKNQFDRMQIIFLSGTKFLWLPQYVNTFLVWHKKFGPAQNILGPVKWQGINHLAQNVWDCK